MVFETGMASFGLEAAEDGTLMDFRIDRLRKMNIVVWLASAPIILCSLERWVLFPTRIFYSQHYPGRSKLSRRIWIPEWRPVFKRQITRKLPTDLGRQILNYIRRISAASPHPSDDLTTAGKP